ncbi:hypothetical protein [Kordiimonas sp.]|uniref:hypothetical protein n=1 Tax=Kordiimonas sp. TaxID=1970157 RepID=UPI003A8E76F1
MASVKDIQKLVDHVQESLGEMEVVRVLWRSEGFHLWAMSAGEVVHASLGRQWDASIVRHVGSTEGKWHGGMTDRLRGIREPRPSRTEDFTAIIKAESEEAAMNDPRVPKEGDTYGGMVCHRRTAKPVAVDGIFFVTAEYRS